MVINLALVSNPNQNFLERLDRLAPQSRDRYKRYLGYYLQFLKLKNPNSLITKRYYSPKELENMENKVKEYILFLKKHGLSQSTIKGRNSAIEFFYVANRIALNWKYISGYIPKPDKIREDLAYTTEDIQKMLNAATQERDKVAIYLLSSTGMRIGALPDLKVGDKEPIPVEGYPKHLYKITVHRGEREEYYTFTSFEAAEALDSYLKYRERNGETITKDSPLLRNHLNSNLMHVKKINEPQPIKNFANVIYRIVNKAGLRIKTNNKQHKHDKKLDHAFRKFAITQLEQANVKYETREFLTGHKTTRGLDKNYLRLSVKDRLAEYMKAVELLTIFPTKKLREKVAELEYTTSEFRQQSTKQFVELTEKYDSLDKKYNRLVRQHGSISNLAKRLLGDHKTFIKAVERNKPISKEKAELRYELFNIIYNLEVIGKHLLVDNEIDLQKVMSITKNYTNRDLSIEEVKEYIKQLKETLIEKGK